MPILTQEESTMLLELANPNVTNIGRKRLLPVLGVVNRLHDAIQAVEADKQHSDLLANAFWLAAAGILTEEMVLQNPRLSARQKDDVLSLIQMRYDAEAWRGCTDYVPTTALPTAELIEPSTEELHV